MNKKLEYSLSTPDFPFPMLDYFHCPACYGQEISLDPEAMHGRFIRCAYCKYRLEAKMEMIGHTPDYFLDVAKEKPRPHSNELLD